MDKINAKGVLKLEAFKDGVKVWELEDNNLIVANGYISLLQGLTGTANKAIDKIQAGTNGIRPASTDTAITAPLDLAITGTVITASKLTITFGMDALTGNGMEVAEFGIILKDGSLFSRKSWTPFTKIADLTINGTWKIFI